MCEQALAVDASGPAAPERLIWDKTPLQIALGIGPDRERSITFPAQMHIGVPPEVAALLRVQTVGPTSYVTALARQRPTLVLLDDWQWADMASREILRRLRRGAA